MKLPPGARRKTAAVFLSYEANTLLEAGEVDHAAATAQESLLLATQIGAPRCVALVRDMLPGFEKYRRAQQVDEFLELART
ncbi:MULTISPECIES: hypothetical protein [unclassified Streptomyces]|uniref:hypothetical protein n=1 Tax=unclassified Streptomyces TaxID=2593676 RepID=UPI00403CEAEA